MAILSFRFSAGDNRLQEDLVLSFYEGNEMKVASQADDVDLLVWILLLVRM